MARKKAVARLQSQSSREANEESSSDAKESNTYSGSAHSKDTQRSQHKAPAKGAGVLPREKEAESASVDSKDIRDEEDMAEEGVSRAIKGLARMERRLRRDVKRQKLKLEESSILVQDEVEEKQVFKSRAPRKGRDAGGGGAPKTATDPLPTPERETADAEDRDYAGDSAKNEAPEAAERGAARPPPVNSSYLPLPWKGRLGYACLNTYLRNAKPSVFSSRTCRMSSIIDHRHPLQDPSQPEHTTKNRPDRTKKADVALGQKYVQELGLANARDIVKMIRWNDKYGIKFMRLSSEMFPFASHHEHGYKLKPFASEVLLEAGKVAGELGHRLTTHPGQFTQLGSPRDEVVAASIRDLEYHDEMLSLLQLPPQQDRDAVMILHMGGVFGDKEATLDRFRRNYQRLSPSVKARLVLENDDVSWSVHDLLPICEELNIPLVLDFHHHNIVFDASQVREGTLDISAADIAHRIRATWTRKGITQKMHYSEPCSGAITPRDRRKHSPRVATLPPCPPDMDLMIEAKDKEQAVFELMKNFKLPGFELINDMVPHERDDESKPPVRKKKTKGRKRKRLGGEDEVDNEDEYETIEEGRHVPADEVSMGGALRRVYWPHGMEDWLRPKKKDAKTIVDKDGEDEV